MKKILHCVGEVFKDCYKAFPAFFLLAMALDGLGVIAAMLEPVLLARILELAGGKPVDGVQLIQTIGAYGICLAYVPVSEVLFRTASQRADIKGAQYFGNKLVAFSRRICLEVLENPETLDRFHRANAAENSQFVFFKQILLTVRNGVTCVGLMAVVGRFHPVLVLSGLLALVPSVLTKLYFEKKTTALRRMQSKVLRRLGYIRGLFSNKESIKEMRVMGFESYLIEKWNGTNAQRVEEYAQVNLDICKKQVWGIIVTNTGHVLNIALSFFLLIQGRISVGAFAACLSAFTAYESGMTVFLVMLFNAISTYHVVEDYYAYFTIPTERDGEVSYHPFQEAITASDVHFSYSGGDREVLRGVDCAIRKGEHVVIVGENGSGKTTFSKLLTGAFLPSQGRISYDGLSTEEMNRGSLYAHYSIVPQDFVRYWFSLRENVGISDLDRCEDTEAMEALLEKVAGSEFLENVGGLDVQLGKEYGGQELSGGQWQKVAIARGLWRESDIIILDEPTSALDPLVEYDVLSKFAEMIRGRTSVIISHRVGICRMADKILVMKGGCVVECGRHEELLAAGGEYAHIWQEQAKWYQNG